MKFCESSSLKGKQRKGKQRKAKHAVLQVHWLEFERPFIAIWHCAPLSQTINIFQDSEFMSVEGQAIYERKRRQTRPQNIYSVRRQVEIESIPHGRAKHGRRLERFGEVNWVYLVFVVFPLYLPRQRGMAGAYKAVIWFLLIIVTNPFLKLDYI